MLHRIELKKIINCLKQNGYDYTDLAGNEYSKFAIFKKDMPDYADEDGNNVDSRFIKIEIEFDNDIVDGIIYDDDKGNEFIQNLIDGDTARGTRKRIIKRKKTTRRNRKTKK